MSDQVIELTPKEIITTIKNKKTGEVYKTEEDLKASGIPEDDIQRDVTVIMPALDLTGKTI
jgi:sulfur transfer complex TusBCD TusB component (DsrH family)